MNPSNRQRAASPPRIFMRWLWLSFMHWRIEPARLRALIPDPLEIDTFDGSAWVGLVPFTMRDVSHYRPGFRGSMGRSGRIALPTARHFHECNVRTYVTCPGRDAEAPIPGVWFFSLDAASRLAVVGAKTLWNLPYWHSTMTLRPDESRQEIFYTVQRRSRARGEARLRTRWRIGGVRPPSRPGQLDHFLTERYALYSQDRRGNIWRGPIAHEPWVLRDAETLELDQTLLPAAGIDLDTSLARNPPITWHADGIREVDAWTLQKA